MAIRSELAAASGARRRAGGTSSRHILVVGGGPAGLAAAIAAAEAGANVVLLDERTATGGQYTKPLSGALHDAAPDARFRLGRLTPERAVRAGVTIETEALVWGAFAPDEIAVLLRGAAVTFHPRRLILATGAHERPVPIPGWTLPGVLTTGGLQTLVRTQLGVSRESECCSPVPGR